MKYRSEWNISFWDRNCRVIGYLLKQTAFLDEFIDEYFHDDIMSEDYYRRNSYV